MSHFRETLSSCEKASVEWCAVDPLLGHERGSPFDVRWIWAARTVNCLVSFLMPYTLDHVCPRLQPQCCGQTKFNMESPWLRKWWSSKWFFQYFLKFSREGSHNRLPEILYTLWWRSGLWLPYLKTGEVRCWKWVWERGREGQTREWWNLFVLKAEVGAVSR